MDKYMCLKLILHNPFVPVLPIFLHISDIYMFALITLSTVDYHT